MCVKAAGILYSNGSHSKEHVVFHAYQKHFPLFSPPLWAAVPRSDHKLLFLMQTLSVMVCTIDCMEKKMAFLEKHKPLCTKNQPKSFWGGMLDAAPIYLLVSTFPPVFYVVLFPSAHLLCSIQEMGGEGIGLETSRKTEGALPYQCTAGGDPFSWPHG